MTKLWAVSVAIAVTCGPVTLRAQESPAIAAPGPSSSPNAAVSTGQTIYVPAYSSIGVVGENHRIPLATTLSIHNTDPKNSITLTRIRYHDTGGKAVRDYLDSASTLAPFATHRIFVERTDSSGGSGANFIVAWKSEQEVSAPIVEAIMVSAGTQGISFTSRGRVISRDP